MGGTACALTFDAADATSCRRLVDDAVAALGRLDIVANIAGILQRGPFEEIAPEEWDRVIAVNLTCHFHIIQQALPHLTETRGNIVNMASSAGIRGVAMSAAYSASKHGVVGLTKSLSAAFKARGIRVNAIAPGPIDTPLIRPIRPAPGAPGPLRLIAQLWPVYLVLLIISIGTFMPSAGGPFLLLAKGIKGAGDQGTILAVGSFSGVITSAGYGFLRRWFSDWVLFIVIAGSMGLGLAAVAPLQAWSALFAAFLLIGLGTGFKAPVVASVLMAEAPAHVRAAAAGLNFSCIFLGQALGPFVLRLLVGPFGIQETFLITGGTLLMTAAAIALTGIGKAKPQAAAAGASA